VSPSPPLVHRIESLLNLVYLCDLDAESPGAVREYMRQAQIHLDALIEMQELRPGSKDKLRALGKAG